ncbi:MAG: hypothetical protein ACRDH6_09015 [Actinomycetota bacterium]
MRRLTGVLALAVAMSLAFEAAPVGAADPPEGTLDPKTKSVEWAGPAIVAAVNPTNNVAEPGECLPAVVSCDEFTLTVNVPSSLYLPTGGVTIAITWGTAQNDYDLYVLNEAGEVVGSSATSAPTEQVVLPRAAGTYTVQVLDFAVVADQYQGTATLSGVKKAKPKKKAR